MEVILVDKSNNGYVESAVVKIDSSELAQILGLNGNRVAAGGIHAGTKIELCERIQHIRTIESKIAEAKSLPGKLRTIADMLEMNVPAIAEVVEVARI